MGFDCTLHVIDPGSIDRFVARFLGKSRKKSAFDKHYPVESFFEKIQSKLDSEPQSAGRALLEALILYCSTETPHVYSRGFAFDLWDRWESELGGAPPSKWFSCAAVAESLSAIVERYPQLKGHLYTGFDGNYAVGHYVPPETVPELRAWLKRRFEEVLPQAQAIIEPLLHVLELAEKRGFGYWEATDLGVVQTHEKWLDEVRPKADASQVKTYELPCGLHPSVLEVQGDRMLLSSSFPDLTAQLDLSVLPPTVQLIDDFFVMGARQGAGGSLYCIARYRHQNPYRPYRLGWTDTRPEALPNPFEGKELDDLYAIGEQLYLSPAHHVSYVSGAGPQVWDGHAWKPLAVQTPEKTITYENASFFAGPFDSQGGLLIWFDQVYRVQNGELSQLDVPKMQHTRNITSPVSCVLEPSGAMLLEIQRRLVSVDRDGKQTELCEALENVMGFAKGPEDALVVWHGDTLLGLPLKVLWRQTGQVTLIPKKLLPSLDYLSWAGYLPRQHVFAVVETNRLHCISWSLIAQLPRITLEELSQKRADMLAKEKARADREKEKKHQEWRARIESAVRVKPWDAPESLLDFDVVEHPEYGRGMPASYTMAGSETITINFLDGVTRTLERPKV